MRTVANEDNLHGVLSLEVGTWMFNYSTPVQWSYLSMLNSSLKMLNLIGLKNV